MPEDSGKNCLIEISENDLNNEDGVNFSNKWLDSQVKLLLACIEELRGKVGKTARLESKKKMWQEIETRFKEKEYHFNVIQIENKYKSLERQYKKVKQNNNLTGRNKMKCPFEDEMNAILTKRPSMFSGELLGTERTNEESLLKIKPSNLKNTASSSSMPDITHPSRESSESRDEETRRKRTRNDTVAVEFKNIREAKEKYYEKFLKMKEEYYKKQLTLRESHYKRKEEKKKNMDKLIEALAKKKKKYVLCFVLHNNNNNNDLFHSTITVRLI